MDFDHDPAVAAHEVRLFPTIRISSIREAELRAKMALLAMVSAVSEFGRWSVKAAVETVDIGSSHLAILLHLDRRPGVVLSQSPQLMLSIVNHSRGSAACPQPPAHRRRPVSAPQIGPLAHHRSSPR
jgi:hypothetical protein